MLVFFYDGDDVISFTSCKFAFSVITVKYTLNFQINIYLQCMRVNI